jgi:hypothetical protein
MGSLSEQLRARFAGSDIDSKQFVPLDHLDHVISEHNIKLELEATEGVWTKLVNLVMPSNVPKRVAEKAKKIFAALVLMDRAAAIYGLLEEGLTDDHLPLHSVRNEKYLLSRDNVTTFPFEGWRDAPVNDFIDHKQWLFLAPVLHSDGQFIKVDEECALPFTKSTVIGSGGAGIVHRATLHQRHQQGYEVSVRIHESNLLQR